MNNMTVESQRNIKTLYCTERKERMRERERLREIKIEDKGTECVGVTQTD